MKYLLPLLLLSGCGVSYQFQPFQKQEASISREEVTKAFQERDKYLNAMAEEIKLLKDKKK
jgi:hypothetical protein